MPTSPLELLPDADESRLLLAARDVLTTDPTLAAVVATWSFVDGEGEAADGFDLAFDDPDPAAMPAIRVEIAAGSYGWLSTRRREANVGYKVTLWVPTPRQRLAFNLWGAIRRAVSPVDPDRRSFVVDRFRHSVGDYGSVRDDVGLVERVPRGGERAAIRASGSLIFHFGSVY